MYHNNIGILSNSEKFKRIIKYIVFFLTVSVTIKYIPKIPLSNQEMLMIVTILSIIFIILDTFSPAIKINDK